MKKEFEEKYQLIEEKQLPEIGASGFVYEHRKTGARFLVLKCDDPNKVMYVGFRTPAKDSTGSAHILEHSVLCGSEKYPSRNVMVELAKGSMNTFLNAMTYPDKTVYPVASLNDQDFTNLCSVYLDAVFRPMVMKEKRIFLQEGWHYETNEQGKLSLNGVVFNEMKGVYSNADSILGRTMLHSLYPHTGYAFEPGGDPMEIPNLSYEAFIDFYRQYYHPSNSYFYLYGDMDAEEKMLWIDREYLSTFERITVDSEIVREQAHAMNQTAEAVYSVSKGEGTEGKTQIARAWSVPFSMDSRADMAMEVLQFYLMEAPGAPLREKLLDRGLGEDVDGSFDRDVMQPYWSLELRNTEAEALPEFRDAINEILEEIVSEGLDETSLRAAINYIEFKYREADYGGLPSGLVYGLTALSSWIYGKSPFLYLTYETEFQQLKEAVGSDYYEDLIRRCFLDNSFAAEVVLRPQEGYSEKMLGALDQELEQKEAGLSEEELAQIRAEEEDLKNWQSQEETEEVRTCIPRLHLSDLKGEPELVPMEIRNGILMTEASTNGIAIINLIYDLSVFTEQQLQFAAFLQALYSEFDTEKHCLKDLTDETLLNTGGITATVENFCLNSSQVKDTPFMPALRVEIRCLKGQIGKGLSLALELVEKTLLEDEKRIEDKLMEELSQLESQMDGAMHMLAIIRALSYLEGAYRLNDLVGGIAYYDFLCGVLKMNRSEVHKKRFFEQLRMALKAVASQPFETALTGDAQMLEELSAALKEEHRENYRAVKAGIRQGSAEVKPVSKLNEGIKSSSMVNYVAASGYYLAPDESYDGAVEVLRNVLSYEYLWPRIRVQGGAYGCFLQFARSGKGAVVSYRDPNLKKTLEQYLKIPEWVRTVSLTKDQLEQHIIGTISSLERPMTPSIKAQRAINYFYSGFDHAAELKKRNEILGTDEQQIRSLAENMARMLKENCLCVVGRAGEVEKEAGLFRIIRSLKGR